MSVQVRRRREAAAFLASFVGAQGELLVDTTNNRVQVHDGTTPGGWAAAKLSEVIVAGRTVVADATYNAVAADRTIAVTGLTAARIINLPAASAYPTGTQLLVVDESGACNATRTLTVDAVGSDTINGAAVAVLAVAYGYIAMESDGASKWTIVDLSTASMAQQAASSVAITGGAINATSVGASTSATGRFSTLTSIGAATLNSLSTAAATITGGTINGATIGATTAASGRFTTLIATGPTTLASYTVATLPAAGTIGRLVWCSNARMQTSTAGALEAAGAGTGGLVTDNGTAWKIAGTNITASA